MIPKAGLFDFYILPIQLLIHVYAIWSRFLLFALSGTNEGGIEGGHGEGSGGGCVYGERPIEVDGYDEGPGEGLDEEPGGEGLDEEPGGEVGD